MVSRRKFLKYSLIAGGTVAAGATFYATIPVDEISQKLKSLDLKFFNDNDEYVLLTIIPVILQGTQADAEVYATVIKNMDDTIQTLPLRVQTELRELMDILASKLARATLIGIWAPWRQASPEQISEFLTSWRNSFIDLLQVGYQGLKSLVLGSYYAESNSWQSIGYMGPPNLGLGGQ